MKGQNNIIITPKKNPDRISRPEKNNFTKFLQILMWYIFFEIFNLY